MPAPIRTSYVVFGALMVARLVMALDAEEVDIELADRARPVRFALGCVRRSPWRAHSR
ncbi:hypothetical protein [Kribbella sp. NPDC050459]|uniref:hypothetical protein n=1 Tax=Kribbella sp. NPDC050459 TaxID=3155785 RepID=UPI0033E99626